MGKSGGYKKKSALTGTEKKTSKLAAKESKAAAPYRQQGNEILSKIASGQDYLSDMLQKQNAPGGQPDQNYQRFYEPIRQESQRQFQQNVLPDVMHQFGRSDSSKGGSALNQALASAATNLQSNLNAQLAQYGQQQQQLQYNAAQNLTQAGMPQAQLSLAREKNLYIPKGENIGAQLGVAGAEGAAKGAVMAAMA
jgi:hypothetical protein